MDQLVRLLQTNQHWSRTHSKNWSNMSRGNHHRKKEEGLPPVEGEKGDKARAHDRLIVRIKEVLALTKRFIMENPAGGLEKLWYMMDWRDKKKVIEMCAFASLAIQEDNEPMGRP